LPGIQEASAEFALFLLSSKI